MRVGYKTRMRFYRDTMDATEVVWYPVPDDRPFLPFAHAFASDEWVEPNSLMLRCPGHFGIGEQFDPDRIRPGRPLPRRSVFRGVYCGTLQQWQQGDGLPVDQPPLLADGFPPCCGPMLQPWPVLDCPLMYTMALLVEGLYTIAPTDGADVYTEFVSNAMGGPFELVAFHPHPEGTLPRYAVFKCDAWFLVIIGGTENVEQWMRQTLRAGQVRRHDNPDGTNYQTNDVYESTAVRLMFLLAIQNHPDWNVLIGGHSLGGAVANILAIKLRTRVNASLTTTITFGSPRCMDLVGSRFAYPGRNHTFINIWNIGDIIPALPPHPSELTTRTPLGEVIRLMLSLFWADPPGQFSVDAQGRFTRESPGGATIPLLRMLAGFISENIPFAVPQAHDMDEYRRRLSFQRCDQLPAANPSPTPAGPDLWLRGNDLLPFVGPFNIPLWPPGPGTTTFAIPTAGTITAVNDYPPGTACLLTDISSIHGTANPTLQLSQTFVANDFTWFTALVPVGPVWGVRFLDTTAVEGNALIADSTIFTANHIAMVGPTTGRPFLAPGVACWRRTGTVWELWFNGVRVASANGLASAINVNFIRQSLHPAFGASTALKEVIAYKRSLSEAEMRAVFAQLSNLVVPTMLTGQILSFPYPVVLDGLIPCDGTAYDQTTFPELYAFVGNNFDTWRGAPAPPTGQFRVPDYRGLSLVGGGPPGINPTTSDRSALNTGGQETHTLTLAESPAHNHGLTDPGHRHTPEGGGAFLIDNGVSGGNFYGGGAVPVETSSETTQDPTGITIGPAGGDGSHNNMQPFGVVYYYIYAAAF